MKKFINQILVVILSITCLTMPVFAADETDPDGTSPIGSEKTGSEENDAAERDGTVSTDEGSSEEQPAEETETSGEATLSEESEGPAETTVSEETEESEGTGTSETEEETTVSEEEKTEPEEVSLITLDPVSYNGLTISVSYDSDAFGGKKVEMKTGDPGEVETAALEGLGQYKAVDITFVDEEGNPVQPEEGKSVSVVLKADEMENADNAIVAHVEGDGKISFLEDADINASNPVVKQVKTGETTTTVTVPEETEKVLVNDYKDEFYFDFEVQEKVIEVPAVIGYRYVLKSKVVRTAGSNTKLGKNTSRSNARAQYYLEEEPYVIREGYTKVINVTVPVLKTRKVLVGSHYETKVINEAYTYEKTDDVYEDVEYSDVEAAFAADSFSVYALVVVDEDGGIDFDETFGENHIAVKAPAGAFDAGTVMKIETVDDPDVLVNALKALDDNQTYAFYAVDISFWKGETEVEPRLPVEVVWESVNIEEGDQLVHIDDENSADLVSATVEDDKAVFTAREFSTYTTTRLSEIDLNATNGIVFDPSSLTKPATMPSGYVADTHPKFDGYTFDKAVIVKNGVESTDPNDEVVYLGSFIYQEGEGESSTSRIYVYYRTIGTQNDSDLIVKLAEDELVRLKYISTPLLANYVVRYNGTDYTLGAGGTITDELRAALGSDADSFSLNGPESVSIATEIEKAITLSIPRGYSARVAINGTNMNTINGAAGLGQYSEPTYTLSSDNKVITKTGELITYGVYDFIAVNTTPTVLINLEKRDSFTFDASYFLSTVYTGGSGRNSMGDSTVNTNSNARVTGDGSLGRSGSTKGTKTFTADSVSWSFTTNNTESSHWLMDALEINGTTIEVPYGDRGPVSKTTQLPTGTVVTVTLNSVTGTGRNARRNYTIAVSNAYENIVISGGNIYNADNSTEIIPEVLDNVIYDFYGFDSSDNAYNSSVRPAWITDWGVGEPIAVGPGNLANSGSYDMYRFGQTNNDAMRFSLPAGYVNPKLAYVTSTEGNLHSYVTLGNGLSFGSGDSEYYYPVNGSPNNGYYYFRITGIGNNNKLALLRIKADLARYGVSYSVGNTAITDYTIPDYDFGGYYDDAHTQLQGYNVVDNKTIVIAKSTPVDNSRTYTFLYYTIQGDSSNTPYAPSQKVPLADVAKYGVYDSAKGEYVIPFVAHWQRSEQVQKVNITAKIYLDGELKETVVNSIPKESSVYIDIDSDTMTDFMDKYNWQLFYDEVDSDPFINKATEDQTVELRLYSKFYVYHSSTGELELHTTKELEKTDGSIGTLDIVSLTNKGYLYGGYYMDYTGGHKDDSPTGENLVKAAADYNNDNGTLNNEEINTLHEGGNVLINTIGTPYDPATYKDHVGYWEAAEAYTETKVTLDPQYSGNRGSKDTAALQTGGVGTEVQIARAGIYYIKEVPNSYLRPTHMTTYQRYDRYLRDFILFSTTDDTNYSENSGFLIGSEYTPKEVFTDQLTISFGPNYDETVTNGEVNVDVTNASSNAGGFVMAYRLFHLADESNKNYNGILGNTTFKPYWITLDGITVTGASMRRETVKDVNKDGIIKVDSADGEIKFRDIAAIISAFKR